jgi:hypothetical protein
LELLQALNHEWTAEVKWVFKKPLFHDLSRNACGIEGTLFVTTAGW